MDPAALDQTFFKIAFPLLVSTLDVESKCLVESSSLPYLLLTDCNRRESESKIISGKALIHPFSCNFSAADAHKGCGEWKGGVEVTNLSRGVEGANINCPQIVSRQFHTPTRSVGETPNKEALCCLAQIAREIVQLQEEGPLPPTATPSPSSTERSCFSFTTA